MNHLIYVVYKRYFTIFSFSENKCSKHVVADNITPNRCRYDGLYNVNDHRFSNMCGRSMHEHGCAVNMTLAISSRTCGPRRRYGFLARLMKRWFWLGRRHYSPYTHTVHSSPWIICEYRISGSLTKSECSLMHLLASILQWYHQGGMDLNPLSDAGRKSLFFSIGIIMAILNHICPILWWKLLHGNLLCGPMTIWWDRRERTGNGIAKAKRPRSEARPPINRPWALSEFDVSPQTRSRGFFLGILFPWIIFLNRLTSNRQRLVWKSIFKHLYSSKVGWIKSFQENGDNLLSFWPYRDLKL